MKFLRFLASGTAIPVFAIVAVLSALDLAARFDLIDYRVYLSYLSLFRNVVPVWFAPAFWLAASVAFYPFQGRGRGAGRWWVSGTLAGASLGYFLAYYFDVPKALGFEAPYVALAVALSSALLWRYFQRAAFRAFLG